MEIQESQQEIITDRALKMKFADGVDREEANFLNTNTSQNVLSQSVVAPLPFSLQDIVGRTVQIASFDIDSTDTTVFSYDITVSSVLGSLDILNIVRNYFTYVSLSVTFIIETQCSPQQVGLLCAYFYPGTADHMANIGYAPLSQDFSRGLPWYKKLTGTDIPLGTCGTYTVSIPWESIYPTHLLGRPGVQSAFEPIIGKFFIAPIVPLTIGPGGSSTASMVISLRIDNISPSGFAYFPH